MRTRLQLAPRVAPSVRLKTVLVYVTAGFVLAGAAGIVIFTYLNLGKTEDAFAAGSTYSSAASGNWVNATTWSGGTAPGTTDLNGDNVTVRNAHSVTRIGDISTQSNVTLTITAGSTLTINGNLTVQNQFVLNNSGTLIITGNLTVQNGGTITVNGGGTMNVNGNATLGNNADVTVNGNLTVGGSMTFGANAIFDGSGTVSISGSGCSSWTGTGSCNSGPIILPVELLSFLAKDNGDGTVKISWETATEKNNDYFSIQRSQDGIHFVELGTVKGNGTTKNKTRYHYQDDAPTEKRLYYRLSQTDFDGTTEVFAPVMVEVAIKSAALSVYPNPLIGQQLTVRLPEAQSGTIQIMDQKGNMVFNQETDGSANEVQLELNADVPPGMYYVNFKTQSSLKSTKILKK